MKKRKNSQKTESNQNFPDILNGKLQSRQKKLEAARKLNEQASTNIFKRRVRESSDKKVPKTLRTKAYYRFTKDYPSTVSPDGFRENSPEKNKLSTGKRFALFAVCVFCFIFSFTAVSVGLLLSQKENTNKTDPPVINLDESFMGLHISPETLRSCTTEEIEKLLADNNCNMAVFEFKSEYGYVYFDTENATDYPGTPIADAWEKIDTLKSKGIKCTAYISCFRDTAAAEKLNGMELIATNGELFRDSYDFLWLDPFSEAATEYLTGIIKAASDGRFDYVFLDNICFPTSYSSLKPSYKTENLSSDSRLNTLVSFINELMTDATFNNLIIISDITGFIDISTIPDDKYGGELIKSMTGAYCLDFRADYQNTTQLKSSETFNYIAEMPLAFILEAGSEALDTLSQEKDAALIIAIVDKSMEDSAAYVHYSGIRNVILW